MPTKLNLGGNVSDEDTTGKHVPNVAFNDVITLIVDRKYRNTAWLPMRKLMQPR